MSCYYTTEKTIFGKCESARSENAADMLYFVIGASRRDESPDIY
jgi:hypothetical protein